VSTEGRRQAYGKLLEAQRYIYRMLMQRTQSGLSMYADQARTALLASLQYDPGISESYVALAELTLLTSSDFNEASALCSLATKLNKDSIGGHKFLARILTKQTGFLGPRTDSEIAAKAIREWKEVVRLDPRNAEAWAMLSELYDRTGKANDEIDALKRWEAASMSSDAGWFRRIVGGRPEELMPEQAPSRLAFALGKAGRTKEAIEVLAQQLSDDPDNTEILAQVD
jgi:tetratricopeptide (TPR) repeat protein